MCVSPSDPKLLKPLESLSLVYWFLDGILAVYGKLEDLLPSQGRQAPSPGAGVLHSLSEASSPASLEKAGQIKPVRFDIFCVFQELLLPLGILDVFRDEEGPSSVPSESLECEIQELNPPTLTDTSAAHPGQLCSQPCPFCSCSCVMLTILSYFCIFNSLRKGS